MRRNIFTLKQYLKTRNNDTKVIFQTEIYRTLHTISPDETIDKKYRALVPGQMTTKQLELFFPKQEGPLENKPLDELIGLTCTSNDVFRDFIWGHRLFVTTEEVLYRYLQRFEMSCSISCELSQLIRAKIVSILSYWCITILPLLPEHEKNSGMEIFEIFLNRLNNYGMKKQMNLLKSQICREKVVFTVEDKKISESRLPFDTLFCGRKIKFLNVPIKDFTEQLTLIASHYFRSIELFELVLYNKMKDECKQLGYCIKIFNSLQNYFSLKILKQHQVMKRVRVIERIIDIAYLSYKIQNFDMVVCVITLFSTSPIHRLKNSFENISKEHKKKLEELNHFASPESNWATYRKKVEESQHTPCVPYIGLFLSDMLFINDGIKTQTDDKLINFVKCQKLSSTAQKVANLQQKLYNFRTNKQLEHYIHHLIDKPLVDEAVKFDRSRLIEPPKNKEKVFEIEYKKYLRESNPEEAKEEIRKLKESFRQKEGFVKLKIYINYTVKNYLKNENKEYNKYVNKNRLLYVDGNLTMKEILVDYLEIKEKVLPTTKVSYVCLNEIFTLPLHIPIKEFNTEAYLKKKNIIFIGNDFNNSNGIQTNEHQQNHDSRPSTPITLNQHLNYSSLSMSTISNDKTNNSNNNLHKTQIQLPPSPTLSASQKRQPVNKIRIRYNNREINVLLDTSLTMESLQPIINTLFSIKSNYLPLILTNDKITHFLSYTIPIKDQISFTNTIFLLPYSFFNFKVDETFLTTSQFTKFDVTSKGEHIQLIHNNQFCCKSN